MGVAEPAAAQVNDACSVKSRSDAIVIMVCRPGTMPPAMTQAASLACGSKAMCNVWIWDDADKAPTTAPHKDSDLPKAAVQHAVAVWAHDSKSLMSLKRVRPK